MKRGHHGYTLVEILVAAVIAALVLTVVISIIPRGVSTTVQRATDSFNTARVNQITQTLQQHFTTGRFAGFSAGNSKTLTAVFTTDTPTQVPRQDGLETLTVLNIPGLSAAVGDQVLLTASTGESKLVTIRNVNADQYTLNCPTGLPSRGPVQAWPARSFTLDVQGDSILKTDSNRTDNLGPSQGVSFSYVYQAPSGELQRDPAGSPANKTTAGSLVGFLPTTRATSGIDRTALIPLKPSQITLLNCNQNAVTPINAGRLNLTVLGVPQGAAPDLTLHGPDSAVEGQRPTTSTNYQPIQPGTYRVEAQDITAAGVTYHPLISGSPATLHNPWGDIYLQVRYVRAYGTINVQIQGLPSGTAPIRFTTQSTGDQQTLNLPANTTTGIQVSTGPTELVAQPVNIAGVLYTPTPTQTTADVRDAQTTTVIFTYAPGSAAPITPPTTPPQTGKSNLQLVISGLPTGAKARIPWQTSAATTAQPTEITAGNGTALVQNLQPGTYQLTPSPVTTSGNQYASNPRTALLKPDETTTVIINYGQGNASLRLTIVGLPTTGQTNVTMTPDAGTPLTFAGLQNGDYQLDNLTPGSATLTSTPYGQYAARDERATLLTGPIRNHVTITFSAPTTPTGGIEFTIRGLLTNPPGSQTNLAGPQPAILPIQNGSFLLSNFPVGVYAATMPVIAGQTPNPINLSIPVYAGRVTQVVVDYSGAAGGVDPGEPPDKGERCLQAIRCMGDPGDGATLGADIKIGTKTYPAGTSLDESLGNGQTLRDFLEVQNPDAGNVEAMLTTVPDWAIGQLGESAALGKDVPDIETTPDPGADPTIPSPGTPTDPGAPTDPGTPPADPTPTPEPTPSPTPPPADVCIPGLPC